MALLILASLVLAGGLVGLLNWRHALFAMAFIAAVQDPLRKLVPGSPAWLLLLTMPLLWIAIGNLMLSRPSWWAEFRRSFPDSARAAGWFALACVPAALISATYGPGSWMLTVLGALNYGILLLAIVAGYHFPLSIEHLRRFLGFYCAISAPMLLGGFLEQSQMFPDSKLIGTEQLGFTWIRYSGDYVVSLISGLYRSPDVMGWHAATTCMMALLLGATTRQPARWAWWCVAALAMGALLLCGRRKMVFMVPAFCFLAVWLFWIVGKRQVLVGLVGLAAIAGGFNWAAERGAESDALQIRYYADNVDDSVDQLERHAFDSVIATYRQAGFFGSGLGVATPGSHNLNVARPRVWQESGPSRIMVELGVPGSLALVLLLLSVLRNAWWVNRFHLQQGTPVAVYTVSLFSYFLVNVGSLIVSGQILADPFIASFLGLSLGIVLSFARWYTVPQSPSPSEQAGATGFAMTGRRPVAPPWSGSHIR